MHWKDKKNKQTLEYHNIDKWHEMGFKGKGITFWELEGNDEHGSLVKEIFKLVAPEAEIILSSLSTRVKGDEILRCVTGYDKKLYDIEEFIDEYNVDIIGASLSSDMPDPLNKYLDSLPIIYVGSAGNNGHEGVSGKLKDIGIMSGAIYLKDGEVHRERYSAVGDELDFATLHGWPEGTSFSSPTLAGITALIMSKYGSMTQEKMYEVLKSISIDVGVEGTDEDFGNGVPMLPEDGKIKMLEGEKLIDNKLYTVDEIIEKLKNYDKKEFHIHHTWAPDISDFTGDNHEKLQDAMRNYHIHERGFENIAQHITQFPDGKFMIGRDFSWIPASSKGKRDNGKAWNQGFVFMVENIGNFDKEEVPEIMRDNLVKLGAYFIEDKGTVIFHRQMDSSKSCPGNKFNYTHYIQDVINLVEEKNHWAEKHFQSLKAKGIIIHERRFEDDIDRDETFVMFDRVTDDYIKRIDDLQEQIDKIKNS